MADLQLKWPSGIQETAASGAVETGLIPSRVKPTTLKLVVTASLLDAQHYRDSVASKTSGKFTVCVVGKGTWWQSGWKYF